VEDKEIVRKHYQRLTKERLITQLVNDEFELKRALTHLENTTKANIEFKIQIEKLQRTFKNQRQAISILGQVSSQLAAVIEHIDLGGM
jgi:predicted FMN-binding regulatory protein PaiB